MSPKATDLATLLAAMDRSMKTLAAGITAPAEIAPTPRTVAPQPSRMERDSKTSGAAETRKVVKVHAEAAPDRNGTPANAKLPPPLPTVPGARSPAGPVGTGKAPAWLQVRGDKARSALAGGMPSWLGRTKPRLPRVEAAKAPPVDVLKLRLCWSRQGNGEHRGAVAAGAAALGVLMVRAGIPLNVLPSRIHAAVRAYQGRWAKDAASRWLATVLGWRCTPSMAIRAMKDAMGRPTAQCGL